MVLKETKKEKVILHTLEETPEVFNGLSNMVKSYNKASFFETVGQFVVLGLSLMFLIGLLCFLGFVMYLVSPFLLYTVLGAVFFFALLGAIFWWVVENGN